LLTRPLGFLELISTLSWASLAASQEFQPLAWPSREPSDLSGLEPDGPPWVSLDLSAFGHLFWGPASRLMFQESSDLSGLDQFPLAWNEKPPWVPF
jgi:hypothetical protein